MHHRRWITVPVLFARFFVIRQTAGYVDAPNYGVHLVDDIYLGIFAHFTIK